MPQTKPSMRRELELMLDLWVMTCSLVSVGLAVAYNPKTCILQVGGRCNYNAAFQEVLAR